LATFLSIWLLGRVSRRPHMLAGQTGALCAHLAIGTLALVLTHQGPVKALVIEVCTVTFLVFQQAAISPISWLILSVRSF
jgi:major inositol transporter-like SP family MFS transporter